MFGKGQKAQMDMAAYRLTAEGKCCAHTAWPTLWQKDQFQTDW
jgi:hypothetical protein